MTLTYPRSAIAAIFAAIAVPVTAAQAANSYCAPETMDYCIGATKHHGTRYITMSSFSLRGPVRVCVTHRVERTCRRFRLRSRADFPEVHEFRVRFAAHFPHSSHGAYSAVFSQGGFQIGPTLTFRNGRPRSRIETRKRRAFSAAAAADAECRGRRHRRNAHSPSYE